MTDQRPMPQDADRAERAMRTALRNHADDITVAPIDPESIRRRWAQGDDAGKGRSRRGIVWLAVAAVALIALVLPMSGLLFFSSDSGSTASSPHAETVQDAAAPGEEPTAEVASQVQQVSLLDVVVDVPVDWGYGFSPGADWCIGYIAPDYPFVDRDPLSRRAPSVKCEGDAPDDIRQTSLTWRRAADGDGAATLTEGQWTQTSRVVGSAYITVQVPADTPKLATEILDSARVVVAGPQGCASRIDPGRPTTGGLADLRSVSDVSVCQYDMDGSEGPNLTGSYALYGDDAQQVLDVMLAAPVTQNPSSSGCQASGQLLVVRFGGGVRQVNIDLSACGANLLDDGETYRVPTRATCGDLITGPLWAADVPARLDACQPS